MEEWKTEQEAFWAGDFGNDYAKRNLDDKQAIASRVGLWAKVLDGLSSPISSVLELGANIGINVDALNILLPNARYSAVEINESAVNILRKKNIEVFHESILQFSSERTWDLVFTSGVLIHLNPDALPQVYSLMNKSSSKYVFMSEYYNPIPVEVEYRGNADRMFKRDFAGEFMDAYPEFYLKHYGFVYYRDVFFPVDDINWFCLKRK